MRVAALYDIHGNLPALEAVLAELEHVRPDLVLVGGDVVLGPFPRDTLEALDRLGDRVTFIRGNTDRVLGNRRWMQPVPAVARTAGLGARALTDDQLARFVGLLDTSVIGVDGLGDVLFCHGSPRSDEEILTRATPPERLSDILTGVEQRVVAGTHVQFDRTVGGVRVVNAGSVGMPYEDQPSAYWALLGPDVDLRRTEYDFERAAVAVRATTFPDAEEFAEEHILHPPPPKSDRALRAHGRLRGSHRRACRKFSIDRLGRARPACEFRQTLLEPERRCDPRMLGDGGAEACEIAAAERHRPAAASPVVRVREADSLALLVTEKLIVVKRCSPARCGTVSSSTISAGPTVSLPWSS